MWCCVYAAAGKNESSAMRYGPSSGCKMDCHGSDPLGTCGGEASEVAQDPYLIPAKTRGRVRGGRLPKSGNSMKPGVLPDCC